ncbi:MAG TPA: hypothetical protein VFN61_11705 [Acidimicrobiales bacterium]|nr:hypothetical protein [Acidimicrobiales bacterium]
MLAAVVAGLVVASGRLNNKTTAGTPTTLRRETTTTAKPVPPPAVTASLVGWALPVPISQALVLPAAPASLLVVGGETANGQTASGAFLVSTASGSLHLDAALSTGVRAAAGAVVGNEVLVFGGANRLPVGTIQAFTAPGVPVPPATTKPVPTKSVPTKSVPTTTARAKTAAVTAASASTTGNLPGARAGAVAVTFDGRAYVVGGSNGAAPDASVISTTNGVSLQAVGTLPVAVRFPAAAVLGDKLYVFGGETLVAGKWSRTNDIQEMDLANGHAAVIGHLPKAVTGAVAVDLGGNLYIAGGLGTGAANGTVWGFEPQAGAVVAQATLATPVAYTGAAVLGDKAWFVGGQTNGGKLVGSVQTLQLAPPTPTTAPVSHHHAGTKAGR